jgi:SAM-dependent methyltransferase
MLKSLLSHSKVWGKWLLFPGLDLHTRCRYRFLSSFFRSGFIDTLDAGCGNGALSYAAYKLGNRVLGVSNEPGLINKAADLFSTVGADDRRLAFAVCDLYDLPKLNRKYDQIICSETLEHIKKDHIVVRYFHDLLRPGGVLHLCCPFAPHPVNNLGRVDGPEDGGHVRDGYTFETYRILLQPAGFEIVSCVGLGSPLLVQVDKLMRLLRNRTGDVVALPLFLLIWPLLLFDSLNPEVPLSLYVQAVKR